MNCCCQWGAAVKGEWPEFERPCCPIHGLQFMSTPDDPMCKRHQKEAQDEAEH